ncbi:unnamed protein product [Ostreobium quekettii]|uniref:DUF218 domain-containing protein n=1 Tax=Ostreobium quekettii TaxID=121088 RepID=A0A8S1JHZ9_9CHLO|nr:unnamed protein product [Ostreobium quekettii]
MLCRVPKLGTVPARCCSLPTWGPWTEAGRLCSQQYRAIRGFRRAPRLCSSASQDIAWLVGAQDGDVPDCATDYEAIFVLAGGFTAQGTLPPSVTRRMDAVIDIQKRQDAFCPIVCLGGGTPHKKPPLTEQGYPVHESTRLSEYLLSHGLDPVRDGIYKEVSSHDTIGNVYFALTIHALPARWRKMAIVTSAFHMPRTKQLFKDVFELAEEGNAYGESKRFLLDFFPVDDRGTMADKVLQARRAREAESLKTWVMKSKPQLKSLADMHAWLHNTHLCYAVGRQHEFGIPRMENDMAMASY